MWILVVLLKRNDPFKDYSHIGNKYWGCYVYGFSVWNIHHVWWKQKNRWWLWFLLIEYSVNTQPSVPIWSYVELNMFAMSANVDLSSHAAMLRWLFLLLINWAILGWHSLSYHCGKYLDTPRVQRNSAPSSHIHGGPHHEFNERTPL